MRVNVKCLKNIVTRTHRTRVDANRAYGRKFYQYKLPYTDIIYSQT